VLRCTNYFVELPIIKTHQFLVINVKLQLPLIDMVGKGMVHKDEEIEGTDKDIPDHDIPDQVTPDIIEGAIDERERQEAYMTKEEINLRDTINKELAKRKYHLRLAGLNLSNGAMYDYVQPMA
jgi:hypothetical protein